MDQIIDLLQRMNWGLFKGLIYIGFSSLAILLWNYWEWDPMYAWFFTTIIFYCKDDDNDELFSFKYIDILIGIIILIGLFCFWPIYQEHVPIWVYLLMNSIVCINLLSYQLRKG